MPFIPVKAKMSFQQPLRYTPTFWDFSVFTISIRVR